MDVELDGRIKELFRGLHIDDVSFRNRALKLFGEEYNEDLNRIYLGIKKQTY